MEKKKRFIRIAAASAAFAAVVNLNGCVYGAPVDVPPQARDSSDGAASGVVSEKSAGDEISRQSSAEKEDSGETGTDAADNNANAGAAESEPDFDPDENINVDVYGPPEYFGISSPEDSDDPEDIDAPEDSEESSEQASGLVTIESTYTPDENINACVYGPPEMFAETTDEE